MVSREIVWAVSACDQVLETGSCKTLFSQQQDTADSLNLSDLLRISPSMSSMSDYHLYHVAVEGLIDGLILLLSSLKGLLLLVNMDVMNLNLDKMWFSFLYWLLIQIYVFFFGSF